MLDLCFKFKCFLYITKLFYIRYDASKTCPKPWSQVDRAAKLLRVKVCHLTQFALFWTFIAEYGIVEFERSYNGNNKIYCCI